MALVIERQLRIKTLERNKYHCTLFLISQCGSYQRSSIHRGKSYDLKVVKIGLMKRYRSNRVVAPLQ